MSRTAILVSGDLMLMSQIQAACRQHDVQLITASSGEWTSRAQAARWVFWDLQNSPPAAADILSVKTDIDCTIIAMGPHVDEIRLQAAREAGCDMVLPRGQFVREIGGIIAATINADANASQDDKSGESTP
jgi:hypothetical protein